MRPKKKGQEGHAAKYMTRSQAVRKLQITLKDFRRLCILKGIFPREPKKKFRGANKTYYLVKDIAYLAHDPMITQLRELKVFYRRIKHAIGRQNRIKARRDLKKKPELTLDHVVRERYPNFTEALRDLDDALTMIHLFAKLPANRLLEVGLLEECNNICREFQYYVAKSNSLRKVFLSIKGIYYQAEIMGQSITWVVPYQFTQKIPKDVDFRVMQTFVQFYKVLLGFVNFKLYSSLNMNYPPRIDKHENFMGTGILAVNPVIKGVQQAPKSAPRTEATELTPEAKALQQKVATLGAKLAAKSDNAEEEETEQAKTEGQDTELEKITRELYNLDDSVPLPSGAQKHLFSGVCFFLGRETPIESLVFVIKSFDGQVGWESPGSPYKVDDPRIKYHIVDRNTVAGTYLNRQYVQPQWVFDSINTGVLLPSKEYTIGASLPPHLSPFVDDEQEGYTPARRKELNRLLGLEQQEIDEEQKDEEDLDELEEEETRGAQSEGQDDDDEDDEDDGESDSEDEDDEDEESSKKKSPAKKPNAAPQQAKGQKRKAEDDKQLAAMMMTKKQKDLYKRLKRTDRQKEATAKKLEKRRSEINASTQKPQQKTKRA
eukprot:TRINITY_DN1407_c0_g1_i1.p1 TRINITY_DN1407_c0_g1~~TRINITY_DN1407_c0_g1_i1.p1  ORF type:complete len:602 (+),score=165.16 TRINITY_DN1407_c0_g1_i1:68-1873(+)